jgi:hypothetical protein
MYNLLKKTDHIYPKQMICSVHFSMKFMEVFSIHNSSLEDLEAKKQQDLQGHQPLSPVLEE